MSGSRRQYSDREVAIILRLAARIEVGSPGGSTPTMAVHRTAAEIEDIAAAAGIERSAVRAALEAWHAAREGRFAGVIGGSTVFRVERHIDGELSDRGMAELAGSVPWLAGAQTGSVERQADSVQWQHSPLEGASTDIEIVRLDGETRIRVLANHENPAAWTLLGAAFAGGASALAGVVVLDPSLLAGAGLVAAASAVSVAGARLYWRRAVHRARARLKELADGIEQHARRHIHRNAPPPGPQRSEE